MEKYDLIVIGSGPGGYTAASEGVRQGLKTLLIEEKDLGGTCLNRGCIPTKTFCRSADTALEISNSSYFGIDLTEDAFRVDMGRILERKNEVVMALREGVSMAVQGADIFLGRARFLDAHTIACGDKEFTAEKIIIATGSIPASLDIPGAELCADSDQMLECDSLPESLVIIGGGVIGMEFASIFSALGSMVTVIEYCKEILPGFDSDIAKRLRSALSKRGVKFYNSAAATAVKSAGEDTEKDMLTVEFESKGKQLSVTAEKVLMAVGRKANIPEGFAEAGGETWRKGIKVDDNFLTSLGGVYAIGDCNGICMLAHAATAQSLKVMDRDTDLSPIPAAVFTVPEVASTGLTEEQARQQSPDCKVVKLPLRANGKALAMGATDGMVKIIYTPEKIIGCHILGPHASDLIMEISLAMSSSLRPADVVKAIHPHPTLSELLTAALSQ